MSTLNDNTSILQNILQSLENFPNAQTKEIIPTTDDQIVKADDPYRTLSQVIVKGDSNLVASNIRQGVTIFGIQGTYTGTN